MTDYIAGLMSFTVTDFFVDEETLATGEKNSANRSGLWIAVQRPDRLRCSKPVGAGEGLAFWYDGKTVTLACKGTNTFTTAAALPTAGRHYRHRAQAIQDRCARRRPALQPCLRHPDGAGELRSIHRARDGRRCEGESSLPTKETKSIGRSGSRMAPSPCRSVSSSRTRRCAIAHSFPFSSRTGRLKRLCPVRRLDSRGRRVRHVGQVCQRRRATTPIYDQRDPQEPETKAESVPFHPRRVAGRGRRRCLGSRRSARHARQRGRGCKADGAPRRVRPAGVADSLRRGQPEPPY